MSVLIRHAQRPSAGLHAAFLLFCVLAAGSLLFAQTQGAITGTVSDSSGAAVAGASVKVTNPATNATRTATTNDVGIYSFPELSPGVYQLRVELKGFRSAVHDNIELQVQQTVRIDVALQPGDITQTIEVSA
ncbi:MAG TPA: carboxypeptidase-like regulatory domain-containing protein, partial [Bryobacteraceae bacterium]|nr:carboxypeptidase-like regulatory domain-containing protein [Bryobacteraceae bacterium]